MTRKRWGDKLLIEAPDSGSHEAVVNFITSAWINSAEEYRQPAARKDQWCRAEHALVRKILQAPNTRALLARDTENARFYYGFIVYECDRPNHILIHYTYVKHSFRRMGVAAELLKHAGWTPETRITFTHPSRYFSSQEACNKWGAALDEHAYKL